MDNKPRKHISENPTAKDEFLTEKQCIFMAYHFAVRRSLGLPESEQEEPSHQRAIHRGSETEDPAHK